jgi:hypothetical protein
LAKRHHDILGRLDSIGLNRYHIFVEDIRTVEAYLKIIQAGLSGETTWQEMIRYGGPYGTSILIHEIVEMRVRRLQRRLDGVWYDDAYAYEDGNGQVVFRYNLTWERIGSHMNRLLRDADASLENIETIISSGEDLRWTPIESIHPDQAAAYFAALDQACAIPKPQPVFA